MTFEIAFVSSEIYYSFMTKCDEITVFTNALRKLDKIIYYPQNLAKIFVVMSYFSKFENAINID